MGETVSRHSIELITNRFVAHKLVGSRRKVISSDAKNRLNPDSKPSGLGANEIMISCYPSDLLSCSLYGCSLSGDGVDTGLTLVHDDSVGKISSHDLSLQSAKFSM